ncbi:MAG: leucine-rich repeat domain-containing protein [Bacteroides sp.]|nr:leucine-rich repeat domain-containing protein [Bacteroides sp.]MCM1456781.1 leucine-rich repeat domain-containing protein [Lachnoclostridium sp.]
MKKTIFILMALMGLAAHAYDFEVDGIYYNVVSSVDLTCSVTSGNNRYSGNIVIPSEVTFKSRNLSVTSIGYSAFEYCRGLTSVVIPNSVTSIGSSAFSECSGLTSVVIPNSVTSIGQSAFSGCSGLTSVEIPNSVTSIGGHAFSECSGLTSVVIPNSVTSIGSSAFSECSGLTSVVIPNSVTSIGQSAFSGCSGLTSVEIPNSVTSIGGHAFSECSGLTSVVIPNSVTSIGDYAFYKCSGLTSVEIASNVTNLDKNAFKDCIELQSLTLPPSLQTVICNDNAVFYDCYKITELKILGDKANEYLSFIGTKPFSSISLEELYIGRTVQTYDYYPFDESLKKITFGKYLKKINEGFYGDLKSIPTTAEIYCENPVPPSGADKFINKQYISNVVYVSKESLEDYKQADGWKNFWDIRPFDFESGIADVSIDETRTNIYRVYNPAGILVKETADKSDAFNLPKGIYIVNGKKVAIR